MEILVRVFGEHTWSFLLRIYVGMELREHRGGGYVVQL